MLEALIIASVWHLHLQHRINTSDVGPIAAHIRFLTTGRLHQAPGTLVACSSAHTGSPCKTSDIPQNCNANVATCNALGSHQVILSSSQLFLGQQGWLLPRGNLQITSVGVSVIATARALPELCSRAPSAQATPIPRTSCCIYWPMHCTRRYTSLLRPTHSGNCTGRAPTLTECEVQGNCHYTGTRQCAKTIPTHIWREKVHPKWTTGWLNISCSAKHALQPS